MLRKLIIVILLLKSYSVLAQTAPQYQVPRMEDLVKVPASPEAQAFIKYGNTPVNLFNGAPEISIPIANLKGRELEIPVSLGYDASGLRVEQIPTWVGAGWNLNVGGVVTRNTIGHPDDYNSSLPNVYTVFYDPALRADYEFAMSFSATGAKPVGQYQRYLDLMKKVIENKTGNRIEIEPDTYSFNVMGLSGTLMIDYLNNSAFCIEHPDIKATPTFVGVPVKRLISWQIIDQSGTSFLFAKADETKTFQDANSTTTDYKKYNSAWHLTQIISKTKKDTVEFVYGENVEWEQPQLAGRGDIRIDYPVSNNQFSDSNVPSVGQYYTVAQSELQEIRMNKSLAVKFFSSHNARKDLAGRKSLENIIAYGQAGEQINNYKFWYSYWGDPLKTEDKYFRLRLDKLSNYGMSNSNTPLEHTFEYASGDMPPRDSFAQDFWGYYNAAITNETLIPYFFDLDKNQGGFPFQGADRKPKLNAAVIGTLSRVTYPTKGSTEFTYDLHRSSAESYSYKEEFICSSGWLNGGIDNSNICEPDKLRPKKMQGQFTITNAGPYELTVMTTVSTVTPVGTHIRFLGIYDSSAPKPACSLYNDAYIPSVARYDWSSSITNSTQKVELNLSPGLYKFSMLNSDSYSSISFELKGFNTVSKNEVGGLRVMKIEDKDETGKMIGKRLFYYDDLSIVPQANITESFVMTSTASSGTLHQTLKFEESVQAESWAVGIILTQHPYWRRTSDNRIKANSLITYPLVSEIQFSSTGFSGFSVSEFYNQVDNYVLGFSKKSTLNGKRKSQRVYNSSGTILTSEQSNYSQVALAGGMVGYNFVSNLQFEYDHRVISMFSDPSNEELIYTEPYMVYSLGDFTSPPTWIKAQCPGTTSSVYTTNKCYTLGGTFSKQLFSYGRYWTRLDSKVVTNYAQGQSVQTETKYFYNNTNHYQVTSIEETNSKGQLKKYNFSYPHEMFQTDPANPIWTALINQNRVADQVKIDASVAGAPDFSQQQFFMIRPNGAILPESVQMSSGGSAPETRVRYHKYDAVGNVAEVSKEKDVRVSYLWRYNWELPVAEAKNASVADIFYTSFEDQEGNSTNGDARTGQVSRIGGYSRTLTGLTPNKPYVLTYWRKDGSIWSMVTVSVVPTQTSYQLPLGTVPQLDEVRFYPQGALVTTYTHREGVGVTSISDPK